MRYVLAIAALMGLLLTGFNAEAHQCHSSCNTPNGHKHGPSPLCERIACKASRAPHNGDQIIKDVKGGKGFKGRHQSGR
jgi:hypothetical protein